MQPRSLQMLLAKQISANEPQAGVEAIGCASVVRKTCWYVVAAGHLRTQRGKGLLACNCVAKRRVEPDAPTCCSDAAVQSDSKVGSDIQFVRHDTCPRAFEPHSQQGNASSLEEDLRNKVLSKVAISGSESMI